MGGVLWRRRFVRLAALSAAAGCPAFAASEAAEDRVYAHHMASMNAGRGAMAWTAQNPHLGDPRYYSTGGDYRNLPLVPRAIDNLSRKESADLQIRRAMRIGIDGFAVNAWAGGEEARLFLDALFEVAEENGYSFEIGICPDANTLPQPYGYTSAVVEAIRYLLDKHGDSPNLARRDGKPIVFGYQSVFIWVDYLKEQFDDDEVNRLRTSPDGWAMIGDAFRRIEDLAGSELFFQFDFGDFFYGVPGPIPDDLHVEAAAAVARQLPAVNQFLPNRHTPAVAAAVIAEGAEWGHPIYLNYENNRTDYGRGGPGTSELRHLWEEARTIGSSLIHLTTWNDYHENTNVSPGTTTRYAYYDLTGYMIEWWKSGAPPEPDRDKVYLFSRRYDGEANVFPFRAAFYHPGAIEVLTLLREPATVTVPGRGVSYEAPAGMHARRFPVTPGPVEAILERGGLSVLSLAHPDPVTERPFRQDNGIVAISSECERYWVAEFGSVPGLLYSEYGDDDEDGLPNWFEMYWFGKFNDYSTASVANPHVVENELGLTNLEAYLLQRSPLGPEFEPRTGAFHGRPALIPGLIQAEDFDHGGPDVAFRDSTGRNQGEAYRPKEAVDIEPNLAPDGGFNVAWIMPDEWLQYTVEVATGDYYDVHFRVASRDYGGRLRLQLDGKELTGPVHVPQTGGWHVWKTITVPNLWIDDGIRTLRVRMDTDGFNLNWIAFSPASGTHPIDLLDWLALHFDEEERTGLDILSPRVDGIPILHKYALGGSPHVTDRSILPVVREFAVDGAMYLSITWSHPVARPDIAFRVDVSSDLNAWHFGEEHVAVVSSEVAGDRRIILVRDRTPMTTSEARFLRLQILWIPE